MILLIVVRVQYPSGYKYQVSFHISNNYMSESNLVLIVTSRGELSNMKGFLKLLKQVFERITERV